MAFAVLGGAVSIIGVFFTLILLIPLAICIFLSIVCFFLLDYISTKEKRFSFSYTDMRNAERKVDELVNDIIRNNEENLKKKNKKYHYFYTSKQLRKEKLNKIKKI